MVAQLSDEPLDVAAAIASVSDPSCGAIASFVGTVRESAAVPDNAARRVVRLDYEAHPRLAEERLGSIVDEALERWDLVRALAIHRTGECDVGDPTVVVACAAEHRRAALEACSWIIESIKTTVPIWKREVYEDGTSWVGAEGAVGKETAS
jgi:molybdopterin synthase catalytic subunit